MILHFLEQQVYWLTNNEAGGEATLALEKGETIEECFCLKDNVGVNAAYITTNFHSIYYFESQFDLNNSRHRIDFGQVKQKGSIFKSISKIFTKSTNVNKQPWKMINIRRSKSMTDYILIVYSDTIEVLQLKKGTINSRNAINLPQTEIKSLIKTPDYSLVYSSIKANVISLIFCSVSKNASNTASLIEVSLNKEGTAIESYKLVYSCKIEDTHQQVREVMNSNKHHITVLIFEDSTGIAILYSSNLQHSSLSIPHKILGFEQNHHTPIIITEKGIFTIKDKLEPIQLQLKDMDSKSIPQQIKQPKSKIEFQNMLLSMIDVVNKRVNKTEKEIAEQVQSLKTYSTSNKESIINTLLDTIRNEKISSYCDKSQIIASNASYFIIDVHLKDQLLFMKAYKSIITTYFMQCDDVKLNFWKIVEFEEKLTCLLGFRVWQNMMSSNDDQQIAYSKFLQLSIKCIGLALENSNDSLKSDMVKTNIFFSQIDSFPNIFKCLLTVSSHDLDLLYGSVEVCN